MTKNNVPHATGGEKEPPEATDHVAPEPTGGLPSFAEVAWRGPFADHRAPFMHGASTREGCS